MRTKAKERFIRERRRRLRQEAMERGKTKRGAIHTTFNPAGSKLLRAAFKARHGVKATGDAKEGVTPIQEARRWYRRLIEPMFRVGESKQRIAAIEARA